MATIQINAGETELVAADEERYGGPMRLDGTLALDGTVYLNEVATLARESGLSVANDRTTDFSVQGLGEE